PHVSPIVLKPLPTPATHSLSLHVALPISAGVPLNTPVAVLNVTPLGSAPFSLNAGAGKPEAVTVKVPFVPSPNVVLLALVITGTDRKSTRLNSSHVASSYGVFCLTRETSP